MNIMNGLEIFNISPQVIAQIKVSLLLGDGREICGYLLGRRSGDMIDALKWISAQNLSRDDFSFTVSYGEECFVSDIAKDLNLELIGFGHSHPSHILKFSRADLNIFSTRPYVWLIFIDDGFDLQFLAARSDNGKINLMKVEVKN